LEKTTLLKQKLLKKEKIEFDKFYAKLPKDLIKYRNRIKKTQSDILPSIFNDIRKRYSPIILICGRPRSGKSMFAIFLANAISSMLYYEWFNMDELYFYPKDLLRNITNTGYQIMVLDEAGSSLNKREWHKDFTFSFDKILQTQGFLNNVYIFVLPFASDLVKDCRKYIDFLCYTKKRGLLRCKKMYKREDQLVSDLKAFRTIYIEDLYVDLNDLPKNIWDDFVQRSERIKNLIRKNITDGLDGDNDWLK
jgi:hypothetical protein